MQSPPSGIPLFTVLSFVGNVALQQDQKPVPILGHNTEEVSQCLCDCTTCKYLRRFSHYSNYSNCNVFLRVTTCPIWLEGDHSCGRKRCRGQFGLVHLLSEFPYLVYKCANKFKLLCKQRFWDVFGRMTQVKLQYLQVAERYQPARQNWGSGPGMATGLYIKII